LKGKIMSGNPVFRGTRVPVHMLAELVPSRACARTRYRRGSVTLFFDCFSKRAQQPAHKVIDICAEAGIAFIPWYPLAAGSLASPNPAVARIAQRHGATASQISLAWLLQRSPAMLPIPGTSSIAHLEENLASASIRLTSDELRTLASL